MARIKIEDIPDNIKLDKEEMKKVLGGLETRFSLSNLQINPRLTNATPELLSSTYSNLTLSSITSFATNATNATNALTGF
jgi:hypothetical protein